MSYDITLSCDVLSCGTIQTADDIRLPAGWHEHNGFHYCSLCWPKVISEMNEEEIDED